MNIQAQTIDLSTLPEHIQKDISEYCLDNRVSLPETVYDALHFWLRWNGIIGYTSDIATIVNSGEAK